MNYYAKRGNKILRIGEDNIERYLGQGYNITDANGNIVKKGTPRDANLLSAEYKAQAEENERLKAEIARLMAELGAVKAENASLKGEVEKLKSAEPETAKPATRRRKQAVAEETEE